MENFNVFKYSNTDSVWVLCADIYGDYQAKTRIHWIKMSMNLKQISRIMVQFSPWTQKNSSSAREFLARIICQQSTNPDCKIERKIL